MVKGLEQDEIDALALGFCDEMSAQQLLEDVGIERSRHPTWYTPRSFWREINTLLKSGIIDNGRIRVLSAALQMFPANVIFARSMAVKNPRFDDENTTTISNADRSDTFFAILDPNATKADIQRALRYKPEIFHSWRRTPLNSQLQERVPLGPTTVDFAIGVFQLTPQIWEWTLVILGLPSEDPFTESGEITPELADGLRKANEYRYWIQSDRRAAGLAFPDITPSTAIALLIGRRSRVTEQGRKQLAVLRISMPGTTVNTYDSLIEHAKE